MPPTTGGSTNGSRISGLIQRTRREPLRANTIAIGTPNTMHNAVLAAAVLKLSSSAVRDDRLVINDQNCDQSTLSGDRDQREYDEDRADGGGDVDPTRQAA